MNYISRLRKMIYPNKCVLCREVLSSRDSRTICDKCTRYLITEENEINNTYLRVKNFNYESYLENDGGYQSYTSGHDRNIINDHMEYKVIGLFHYDQIVKDSIRRWKYRGVRRNAISYADLMVNDLGIPFLYKIDAFIPVPIGKTRSKMRGFNQAKDLANNLTTLTGIPTYDCLKRIRDTKPQSQCVKGNRQSNIYGSMIVDEKYKLPQLKVVAIVDDIYTTGSTARECLRALSQEHIMRDTIFYIIVVAMG